MSTFAKGFATSEVSGAFEVVNRALLESRKPVPVPCSILLDKDGLVAAIKYAVLRQDPREDPFLAELCGAIDRRMIVSGIGERPVIDHFRGYGLTSFTSGSVCVAPM